MSSDDQPTKRRGRRVVLVIMALLVTGAIAHRPLLHGVYAFLISEDDVQPVQYAAVISADRGGLDRAAQLIGDGVAAKILIIQRRPPRTAQLGITSPPGDLIRTQLIERGVQSDLIVDMDTDAVTNWQAARRLDEFLAKSDPDAIVGLIYAQHQTRYIRFVTRHSVDRARTDRYRVWSYPSNSFSPDDWWLKRGALVKVAVAYLRYAHAVGFGEGDFDEHNWSPEAYEQSIRPNHSASAA